MLRQSSIPKRVMVIGAGPAGLEAARAARERGHEVMVYEREDVVGGQVNLAAKGAGLRCVATTNIYTEEEDLSDAGIVVTSLGEPEGKKGKLTRSSKPFKFDGVLHVDSLVEFFSK